MNETILNSYHVKSNRGSGWSFWQLGNLNFIWFHSTESITTLIMIFIEYVVLKKYTYLKDNYKITGRQRIKISGYIIESITNIVKRYRNNFWRKVSRYLVLYSVLIGKVTLTSQVHLWPCGKCSKSKNSIRPPPHLFVVVNKWKWANPKHHS